jgi:hypothetical protein
VIRQSIFNRIIRVGVHDALSLLIASETSEYLSLVSEAVVGIRGSVSLKTCARHNSNRAVRDAAQYVSVEEVNHLFATVITRLVDIEAGYANGIAEAARRADNICEANAAVVVRLRSAITEALGIPVAYTADKTRKAAA